MTDFPTNKDLAEKIDDLPDELIRRFDDRYLKKDDNVKAWENADKRYIKRSDAGLIVGFATFSLTILGGLAALFQIAWNLIKGN